MSLSLSGAHLIKEPRLINVGAPEMPFRKSGYQQVTLISVDKPIKTVNIAVCEAVTEILGLAICHAHLFDANWDIVFVLKPPQGRLPWRVKWVLAPLAL